MAPFGSTLSVAFIAVALASVFCTGLFVLIARRTEFTAPKDLWHDRPVAQSGGVAIWAVILAAAWPLGLYQDRLTLRLLIAGGTLAVIGFIDDRKPLKPNTKLMLQLIVAIALLATSYSRISRLHMAIAMPVALLWLVGQSNAVNLLDNMDGACPTVVSTSAITIALVEYKEDHAVAMLCIVIAAAALGFLAWNRKPARVFLGDTGSLSLGFVLAACAMRGAWFGAGAGFSRAPQPLLLMVVPLFNVVFVIITRTDAGVPVSRGLGDHINYRLVAHGFSVRRTLVTMAGMGLIGGVLALFERMWSPYLWAVMLALFTLVVVYFGVFLSHADVEKMYAQLGVPRVAKMSAGYRTQRRRAFEVFGDATVASAAFFLSFQLRFEGDIPNVQEANLVHGVPFVMLTAVTLFWANGLYRVFWKYIGMSEGLRIARTSVIAGVFLVGVTQTPFFKAFPRSVFFLYPMLLGMLATGYRLSLRVMHEWRVRRGPQKAGGHRVLIVGAGDAGELALRGIRHDSTACGFLDDDPGKIGLRIHGVPVLAPTSAVVILAMELGVKEIIVAMPTASAGKVKEIVTACEEGGLRARLFFEHATA